MLHPTPNDLIKILYVYGKITSSCLTPFAIAKYQILYKYRLHTQHD